MENYLLEKLPTSLQIRGRSYPIDTDFRTWIQINELCLNGQIRPIMDAVTRLFRKEDLEELHEVPGSEILDAVSDFLLCQKKGNLKKDGRPPAFSYTYDSDYIIAAFQEFYHIDLISIDHMHWFRFNLLLNSMSSDSELKERVRYRSINLATIKDPKQRSRIRKIQQSIRLPSRALDDAEIGANME